MCLEISIHFLIHVIYPQTKGAGVIDPCPLPWSQTHRSIDRIYYINAFTRISKYVLLVGILSGFL